MIRKNLKRTSKNQRLRDFINKYKIPSEYLSPTRRMVSKAVFIGLFIAFIPMPMQMLAVIAFIPFTKFNVPIALAMCWLSNPFTMPPMYYMEYLTGSYLLGIETTPVVMTMAWFSENIGNIFIPLYVGAAFYSVLGSSLAYYLVNHFWISSVNRDKEIYYKDREK